MAAKTKMDSKTERNAGLNFKKELDGVVVYEAGKPIELVVREFGIDPKSVVKIASNENPLGCSKKAMAALKKAVCSANLYPDDSYFELKDALAKHYGVKSANIIIGAGSDQVIEFCVGALVGADDCVLMAGVTFAMYEVYSKIQGAKIIRTNAQQHDLDEMLELYKKHRPKIVFLCVPNNPLGECLESSAVEKFIEQVDANTLVILDGAYQEFAAFRDAKKRLSPKKIIKAFPNAIYLGTFSKAYGLGGMRVGYGIGEETLIKTLHKIRPPFNITTPSLAAAIAALKDQKFIEKSLKSNAKEMKKYENFAKDFGFPFIKSYTNFITFLCGENKKFPGLDSTKIADFLLKKGVIIRNLASYKMNAIRITIGTESQNRRFFEMLKSYLKTAKKAR